MLTSKICVDTFLSKMDIREDCWCHQTLNKVSL